ncbi:MAG: NPCBM/NEW2 domain-containing protein [Clostridia bacterium]|nr:NPCBM/NEW2 domain-containing protein [Clostridia bacterium]
MKKRLQGFVAGALLVAMLGCVPTIAKEAVEAILVEFANIKIYLDGEEVEAKDAKGNKVEPFIYNGTTYLPVRAVGNAIGKDVSWDGIEKVVYLGVKPGDAENWLDVCGPYQYKKGTEYRMADNKFFTMSGKKYTNGFVLGTRRENGEALFNLDGKYKSVSFKVGRIDDNETYAHDATLNIYVDGIIAYTRELNYDDVAQKITIPLNGALQMKIEVIQHSDGGWSNNDWGFSEGEFVMLD